MGQSFSGLHYSNDGSIDVQLSVLEDTFLCRLLFFLLFVVVTSREEKREEETGRGVNTRRGCFVLKYIREVTSKEEESH